MKSKFSQRFVSFVLALVVLVGVMPTDSFATADESTTDFMENVEQTMHENFNNITDTTEGFAEENEEFSEEETDIEELSEESEDIINITGNRTFTIPNRYYEVITNHEEYGNLDYLAYLTDDEFKIIFINDNFSNSTLRFYVWDINGDNYTSCFGAYIGASLRFTAYTYDIDTLELESTTEDTSQGNRPYAFPYTFIASFNIYSSSNSNECFYDASGTYPKLEIPNPPADLENTTLGRSFTLEGDYLWILQNCNEYGNKDYIAFVYEDNYEIWFFNDISYINFYAYNSINDFNNYFSIRPSQNVSATQYIYNSRTLKFRERNWTSFTTNNLRIMTYSYASSFDVYLNNSYDRDLMFYDVSGILPKIEAQNPPEDVWNTTNGGRFLIRGDFLWLLQNHSEYGNKDYLAYEWNDDIRFWFFDNISNANFSVYERLNDNYRNYFGIRPSRNLTFTEYVYNKNTLKFKRSEQRNFITSNSFTFTYYFTASFDIYWSTSYDRDLMFYDVSGTLPKIEVQNPTANILNVTNGKTFSMQGDFLWLLQNHSEYGNKDYLAYEWNDDIRFWFFDDISNANFNAYERLNDNYRNYFGIRPSRNLTFTEYVYNKNTLKFKRSEQRNFVISNPFTFTYYFTASFDIYTDTLYNQSFYDPEGDWVDNLEVGEPFANVSTVTDGRRFTVPGAYVRLLTDHRDYGSKDFLAYLSGNDFSIFFFEDISNITFQVQDRGNINSYFGIRPLGEVSFTQYIYDRSSLRIKNIRQGTNVALLEIDFPYSFIASFNIITGWGDDSYFYRINGDRPILEPQNEVIQNDSRFNMTDIYCEIIEDCSEYTQGQRYLAYLLPNDLVIWFFDDPEVKFSVWDRNEDNLTSGFGVNPSISTRMKVHMYDRLTLQSTYEETIGLEQGNEYAIPYDFIANLDIYTDGTYTNYFYKGEDNETNTDSIVNLTNGRIFSIPEIVYAQVQYLQIFDEELIDKKFLAYAWEDEYIIWFFDSLNGINCNVNERIANCFGLSFSEQVQVTAYVYDRNTLASKEINTFTLSSPSAFNFGHKFIANFNIYTDSTYSRFFYKAANTGCDGFGAFTPLTSMEAITFLQFLVRKRTDGIQDNLPREVREYYNLLTGAITDPDEELNTKVSFIAFCNWCLAIHIEESNILIDWSKSNLIEWLQEEADWKKKIVEDTFGDLPDILELIFGLEDLLPDFELASLDDVDMFMEYCQVITDTLGGLYNQVQADKVKYLLAYKEYLNIIAEGDEIDILAAELSFQAFDISTATNVGKEEMKKYARYIFDIEQSLPKNKPF